MEGRSRARSRGRARARSRSPSPRSSRSSEIESLETLTQNIFDCQLTRSLLEKRRPKSTAKSRTRSRRSGSRSCTQQRSDGFSCLDNMQQLLEDKDVCILELEGSMAEMRQLLEAAVGRNDALRCKLRKAREMIMHEEEKATVVQQYLDSMRGFMGKGICRKRPKPNFEIPFGRDMRDTSCNSRLPRLRGLLNIDPA